MLYECTVFSKMYFNRQDGHFLRKNCYVIELVKKKKNGYYTPSVKYNPRQNEQCNIITRVTIDSELRIATTPIRTLKLYEIAHAHDILCLNKYCIELNDIQSCSVFDFHHIAVGGVSC
jgi:hypothetical protein